MSYDRLAHLKDKIYGSNNRNTAPSRADIVAGLLRNKWRNEAAKVLNKTLKAYLSSISVKVVDQGKTVIGVLPGKEKGKNALLARIQEFGFGAGGVGSWSGSTYDMRTQGQGLLVNNPGGKLRVSKEGLPYRVISFNFNTAEASAAAGGSAKGMFEAMGGGSGGFTLSQKSKNTPTAWGARLPPETGKRLKPHHHSTQAAGMVRFGAMSGSKGGLRTSRYSTFRTVSMKNPLSWQTKGVEPKRIADKVVDALPEILKGAGLV